MLTIAIALASTALGPQQPLWEKYESTWGDLTRIELETPGGPLPFVVEFATVTDQDLYMYRANGDLTYPFVGARILNGAEVMYVEVPSVSGGGYAGEVKRATWDFSNYDSRLEGTGFSGCVMTGTHYEYLRRGTWSKARGESVAEVPFITKEVEFADDRFDVIKTDVAAADYTGRWSVDFSSSDDPAIGKFEVDENQLATGTFMTTTGDYRYLAGRVDGGLMRLSTFDGAHAFLFHARMQDDGTIAGDFWSGNWWHETWTATRDPDARLPDMFEQTSVTDADALDDLVFKALDGTPTRVADLLDATDAPARVIEIFGSWCPNCADACAELKRLKDLFGDDLGVVGLAFELTDDHERSARQVARYLERHGADWTVLIAGLSDKDKASAELPILDKVRSYPTTIFLNSNNEIVSVHTGFTGPATGEAFSEQQREYEKIIRGLMAEKP